MKRLYQTLLLLLVVPLAANAQTDSTSFSLDECIKYALENTIDVKNARVEEQISEAKVKETFGIGLPQIDGSVAIVHNQKLARFFSAYSPNSPFFGDSPIDGAEEGEVIAAPNFFQLKSSGDASITVNQLIFSSSYLVGLKAADTYKKLSYKGTEQTKIQVAENVAKAYYGVLVNKERIELFNNNIARVDSLLRDTKALNQNGFAEAIDVDRIQVTLNNLKIEKLKFENLQRLGLNLLKFQMNYPISEPITVEGDISTLTVNEDVFKEYEQNWDVKNRIEYKLLETQRDLQQLDLKNKYAASMPSLTGFANLGYMTQSPNVKGLFQTNTELAASVPEDQVGVDKWYSYSRFGVTLNIPLFSGLQRTARVQQSRLSLLKIENSFTSLRQSIDLSIEQNKITYGNSLETLKSQKENMGLAANVARITKIKYEQGVGSNLEVTEAESALREAQVNYYNALYDAMIAKVDLDKAFGKIDPSQYTTTK